MTSNSTFGRISAAQPITDEGGNPTPFFVTQYNNLVNRFGQGVPAVAQNNVESLIIACSDESTALTTGTAKVTFRMPYAFSVAEIRASLTTAQTSGSIFTVDLKKGGASVFARTLTIDNTEKSSTTAASPAVISSFSLPDDSEMTVDIVQVGDGTAKGLKVTLIGRRL